MGAKRDSTLRSQCLSVKFSKMRITSCLFSDSYCDLLNSLFASKIFHLLAITSTYLLAAQKDEKSHHV